MYHGEHRNRRTGSGSSDIHGSRRRPDHVTLSIDVEVKVERLGDFYLAYWVEGPKPAEEPLLSAFRMCDIDSQVTENDRVSGLGSWSTGASTVGTVARFSWMTSRLIRAR